MKMFKTMLMIVMVFLIAGCGNNSQDNVTNETNETNDTSETNESAETSKQSGENTEEEVSKPEEEGPITETIEAIYIGQADSHSIEVETENGPLIIQTTKAEINLDEINEETKVIIEYYLDENSQNILKDIKAVK